MARRKGKYFTESEWEKISKLPRNEIKQRFYKFFKEAIEIQRSKVGVFSLSFVPDNELMWSHYADSHFGYMLHFQIDINEYLVDESLKDVGIPIPVIYKDKREIWDLENYYLSREKHVYDLIRFKSRAWEYECELRLLNISTYGFIKTPDKWLKSIVLGINTDNKLREKLTDIGAKLNLSVFSSAMNAKEYKIDIPGLGISGKDGLNHYIKLVDSKVFELSHP